MENVTRFGSQRKISVLLAILLSASIVTNAYLYVGVVLPLQERIDDNGTPYSWRRDTGMGWIIIRLSHGFRVRSGIKFNVTVAVKLWDPYLGSKLYSFVFRIHERHEESDTYPDVPIIEKNVTMQKGKDAMYVIVTSGNLTVTTPSIPRIYMYRVTFGSVTETYYTMEFPIMVFGSYYQTG
jgi:hypothetical protein